MPDYHDCSATRASTSFLVIFMSGRLDSVPEEGLLLSSLGLSVSVIAEYSSVGPDSPQ
jgi:hypothetical protein